jgi:hypothetical protein
MKSNPTKKRKFPLPKNWRKVVAKFLEGAVVTFEVQDTKPKWMPVVSDWICAVKVTSDGGESNDLIKGETYGYLIKNNVLC